MIATTNKLKANKKLARDYIDQVFNQHNPGKAADFLLTGDVVLGWPSAKGIRTVTSTSA